MARKLSASPVRAKRAARSARHISDRGIDFTGIPEATAEELQRARGVGRPKTGHAKQLIAIRIDPRLLARLRRLAARQAKPYQTLIHELLERAADAGLTQAASSHGALRRPRVFHTPPRRA